MSFNWDDIVATYMSQPWWGLGESDRWSVGGEQGARSRLRRAADHVRQCISAVRRAPRTN